MWIPWNIFIPHGVHMESIWNDHGMTMESMWIPCGFHMDSMEYFHSTWSPYGIHMEYGGRVKYCLWPCQCNHVVFSLIYTGEASITHIMFISPLKIIKKPM